MNADHNCPVCRSLRNAINNMRDDDDRVKVIVVGVSYWVWPGTAALIERICRADQQPKAEP